MGPSTFFIPRVPMHVYISVLVLTPNLSGPATSAHETVCHLTFAIPSAGSTALLYRSLTEVPFTGQLSPHCWFCKPGDTCFWLVLTYQDYPSIDQIWAFLSLSVGRVEFLYSAESLNQNWHSHDGLYVVAEGRRALPKKEISAFTLNGFVCLLIRRYCEALRL